MFYYVSWTTRAKIKRIWAKICALFKILPIKIFTTAEFSAKSHGILFPGAQIAAGVFDCCDLFRFPDFLSWPFLVSELNQLIKTSHFIHILFNRKKWIHHAVSIPRFIPRIYKQPAIYRSIDWNQTIPNVILVFFLEADSFHCWYFEREKRI